MADFLNSMAFLFTFLAITAVCAYKAIDTWV